MRSRLRTATAIAAAIAGLAIAAGSTKTILRTAPQPPVLEVGFWGCERLVGSPEPVCSLSEERALQVRASAVHAEDVVIAAGGREWRYPANGEPEWAVLRNLKDLDGGRLVVTARRRDAEATWELLTAPAGRPPWLREILACRPAEDPRQCAGSAAAAERRLDRDPVPRAAGDLAYYLARLDYRREAGAGALVGRLEDALGWAAEAGDLKLQVDVLTMLASVHFDVRDDAAAAFEALDRLPEAPPGAADLAYLAAYGRGRLAARTGDAAAALELLAEAATVAGRFGRERERIWALQVLIDQQLAAGLFEEAAAALASLDLDTPVEVFGNTCQQGRFFNNVGWSHLRLREAPEPADRTLDGTRALAFLDRALDAYESAGCGARQLANVYVNRALAHLQAGRPELAGADLRHALELARAGADPSWLETWRLDVEGRLASAESRFEDALAAFDELLEVADRSGVAEARWRAHLGRARTLVAMARIGAALWAYENAGAVLDEEAGRMLIDAGRAGVLDARETAVREHLDLLLVHGRAAKALEVARRARIRAVRHLELHQRSRALAADPSWRAKKAAYDEAAAELDRRVAGLAAGTSLEKAHGAPEIEALRAKLSRRRAALMLYLADRGAAGDLPAPRAGELALLFHPVTGGWAGFAWTDPGNPRTWRLGRLPEPGSMDPAELSRRLLEPAADLLKRAERVRILPYGGLRAVDFHALPFGGGPLMAQAPVVYGLDLPPSAAPAGRRALVLGDATGTLTHAGEEVRRVERLLRAAGWSIAAPPEGQVDALVETLVGVDLFHYAGHTDVADRNAWNRGLRLGGRGSSPGVRLRVGDVVARSPAPSTVVLSACDGAAQGPGRAEGLGIAQGFLLAGSHRVVAAVRPVEDRVAAELMGAFYRAWEDAGSVEEALARAQLGLRDRPGDAASFRVLAR